MKLWKALGVAGLAGVAAGGVIIARDQRQRAQLTPDEIRARLQERAGQGQAQGHAQEDGSSGSTESSARA